MNNKTLQRCLALVLTVCMVMGMFVGTVGATEAETASVTATATASVNAADVGHYPVEFFLKNPTTTDYSVTLVKTTGEAEFNYQGTSATNGVIELDARTEQKVTGYLSFTDPAKQQTDVTVQVKSGATVLSTLVIDVTAPAAIEVKSAYYGFASDLEGWTGTRASFNSEGALKIGGFGGSSEANMWAYSPKLTLTTGNVYSLSFKSKTATVFGNEIAGFRVFVQDFDASGNALTLPYSFAGAQTASADYTEFSAKFVVNASKDANYSYSQIAFNAGGINSGNEGRCNLWVDDVLLVDGGAAEMIDLPNNDFETFDAAGFTTVANGFENWQTGNTEKQGTTQKGWGSKTSTPYSGAEMMGVIPGHGLRYNTTALTETEEVSFTAFFKLVSGQPAFKPMYHLGVVEDSHDNQKVITTSPIVSSSWQGASASYTKPADVEKFYIGLDMTNQNEGGWADYFLVFKTGALSKVTSKQIAEGGKITGFTGNLPEAGAVVAPVLPTIPAPTVLITVYSEEELTAALATDYAIRLEADFTVTGSVDMTDVDMNGHKLTMTETASVKGVSESDLVVPKRYELVNTDGTYTIQEIFVGSIANAGRSLSLEGVIHINQYVSTVGFEGMDLTTAGGLLIFNDPVTADEATYANADAVVPGLIATEDGLYAQQTPGIPAKEYADEVYLRVYVKETEEDYYHYGPVMEYSVQDYCESRLEKSTNETMKNLAAAMLHYGTAAQNYFDYNVSDPANANIKAEWPAEAYDPSLITALKSVNTVLRDSGDIVTVGRTLSLDGSILINAYYAPASTAAWTVEKAELLVWDGVSGELTKENASYVVEMVEDGSRYAAATEDFAAKELGKTVFMAAQITDNSGRTHMTEVTAYSPEAYAAGRIANSTNPEMVELAKRMVIYGDWAKQYFGWTDDAASDDSEDNDEGAGNPDYTPDTNVESHPSLITPEDAPHGDYVVYEGTPQAHIMLTENATELEVFAAEELQYHVELVTGATLPLNYVDVEETAFTAEAETTVVYAPNKGYYPVEMILKNPTADTLNLTLRQKDDAEHEPQLIIRGDTADDGVVTMNPYTQLLVTGHIVVDDPDAYPISTVEVEVVENGAVIAVMPISFAARRTAVENADFEAAAMDWTNASVDTQVKYSGAGAMKVPAGQTAAYNRNIGMIPGHIYYLGFYANSDAIGSTVLATITDYDAAGNVLEVPMSLNSRGELQRGSWSWYEFRFLSNTNADAAYAYSVLSMSASAGSLWVDDIMLIDCGEAVMEDARNGGFETYNAANPPHRFTGWWFSHSVFDDTANPYVGERAASFGRNAGSMGYGGFTGMKSGTTYAVSFWARTPDGSATLDFVTGPYVQWQSYPAAKQTQTFTLTDEWQHYEFLLKTPETAENTKYNGTYLNFTSVSPYCMDHYQVYEVDAALNLTDGMNLGKIDSKLELVYKTDFENGTDGLDGWEDSLTAHSGTYSLNLPFSGTSVLDESILMQTNYLYRLGFWAKTGAAGSTVQATVTDYGTDGNVLKTPRSLHNRVEVATDWTYYEFRFTANASGNVNYDVSELSFTTVGNVWIDDVVLVNCGPAAKNELPNSDFELPYRTDAGYQPYRYPDWWMHTHSQEPVAGYSGEQAASFICVASKETLGIMEKSFAAGSSDDLTFSAWLKGKPSNQNGRIEFYVYAQNKSTGTYERVAAYPFYVNENWERYEFTLTRDEAFMAKYGAVQIRFTPYDLNATSAAMDLVSLRSTQIATDLPKDGTIPQTDEPVATPPVEEPMPEAPGISVPAPNGLTIFIATPESYPALRSVFGDDMDWIGDTDGFAVRQVGGIIYIFGTEARGALNGVYDFIEENMDIIWFRADDTAYVTEDTVKPEYVDYREKSPFEVRSWYTGGTGDDGSNWADVDTEMMMTRNKMNGKQAASQNYERWSFWESIGLEPFHNNHNVHALVSGSPVYDPNDPEYWCTDTEGNWVRWTDPDNYSNPLKYQINYFSQKTVEAVAAKAIAELKADPDREFYAIGQTDAWYTTVMPYSAMPFEYAPGRFVQPDADNFESTVFFTWLNKVNDIILEQFPDVKIVTMSYHFTEFVPECEVADNIYMVFCPLTENLKEPYFTTKEGDPNQVIYRNLVDWSKRSKNLVIYNYYSCYTASGFFERPIGQRIQWDMQFYHELGFAGVDPEGTVDSGTGKNSWAMNQLTWWLFQKLTWDPYEDIDALTEKFCDIVYGPASEAMQAYYGYLTAAWDENEGEVYITTSTQEYLSWFILESGYILQMQQAMIDAWKAAGEGTVYQERIRHIKEVFDNTVLASSNLKIQEASALYTTAGKEAVLNATDFAGDIWAGTQVLDNFYDNLTLNKRADATTNVRLLWDEDYIYVGYEMFDRTIENIKAPTDYSSSAQSWWNAKSDDVETYLTLSDPEQEDYYAYFNNPADLSFRYLYRNNFRRHDPTPCDWAFNSEIRNPEGVDNDKWVLIQAISWDSLGLKGDADKDTVVYGYFYRMYNAEDNSEQQIAWNGATVWTPKYLRQIELRTESASES